MRATGLDYFEARFFNEAQGGSQGKERDSETEFEYFEARYLDGRQMRFTSADPISLTATRQGDPQGSTSTHMR
ncbi:MAG: hypothetical protein IPP47_00265 [Bryobacterales bacterium]|nr:hypothetical protein [Bryobacterales bacterium]